MMNRNTGRMLGRKNQKGIGLIELSIALVIAAAVLFGVFALVNKANASRVVTAEAQNLTMMATSLRTKFSNQASFQGISASNMIALGLVPENMINGNAINSGFSTQVNVAAVNLNGQANDGFEFTYQVPAKSCSDFVSSVEGTFSRVNIDGTVVKNTAYGASGGGDDAITVTDLAACDATAGTAPVTVRFAQGR